MAFKTIYTTYGPTLTATTGQIGIVVTTASSATAGTNGATPSAISGYLVVNLGGNNVKLPYYNP